MGFFSAMKSAFSGAETDLENWNELNEQKKVPEVMAASEKRPQLVYKHSHRCSICFLAKEEVEKSFDAIEEKAEMNFVNVVHARSVSNAFAEQTGVRHESPQVLIIKNKEVIWHASHHSIKGDAILEALDNIESSNK